MIDIQSVNTHVMRVAYIHIAGLILLAGIYSSCSDKAKVTGSPEDFPIIHPVVADTVFSQEYVADIQSIQNVEVRARVSGFLEKVHVDEGESVKAGQLLFSISSQAFRDELQKANANLKSAQAEAKAAEVELANTRKLVEGNVVSISELEKSEATLEALYARVEEARSAGSTAQLNLSFATIRAPFDGVINRIPNKTGSLIDEGSLLTTISNNKEVFAYFNLSEIEYLDFVRRGESDARNVSLIMANNEPYPHPGRIETVESEIDKNTGTISFRARFPNPDYLLKHGASGKISLTTSVKNAMLIPQKSTFEIQENLYVFVLNEENVVEMRSVIPRYRLPHVYIIAEGLKSEDRLIYEGIQRVREGDRVTPQLVTLGNVKPIAAR